MNHHERVIALLEPLVSRRRIKRMQEVLSSRTAQVAFVFEQMTDPHNMSAALRSLDAFSFQDAHMVRPGDRLSLGSEHPGENTSGKYQPENRISGGITIGSERWLTLHVQPSTQECLQMLKHQDYQVYASHLGQTPSTSLTDLDFSRPIALVFGNEHAGVSQEVLDMADGNFRIDMHGFVESLNLSVAVAISAFHARQKLNRLAREAENPDLFALGDERQAALYAGWLKRSVNRAEKILAESGFSHDEIQRL